MAYTAASMYGAGAVDGVVERFLPGDPNFAFLPVIIVSLMFVAVMAVGPKLPKWALALNGPIGVALIAYSVATPYPGDSAILYALPVLWTTLFFGRRGAVAIIICVAVGETIMLLSVPASIAYPGRWLDVILSVSAIAITVLALERRNQQLVSRLASEARTDALTGLLNRRGFDERASVEVAHASRRNSSIALVTLDLDYFKRINDEWGHEIGDRVLARLGELIARESRVGDVAARLGGEEFCVLLPDSDSAAADAFTERIRSALAVSTTTGLPAACVSAGIAASSNPTDIQAMLQRADFALYEAKSAGRNRTVVFQEHHLGDTPMMAAPVTA